ncbi:transposase, partial [Kocuria himachalensis]
MGDPGSRTGRPWRGSCSCSTLRCWWRDLPPALGCGSGRTTWRRLREWQEAGVWEKLHRAVLEELSEEEILDGSRASIDTVSVGRQSRRPLPGGVRPRHDRRSPRGPP